MINCTSIVGGTIFFNSRFPTAQMLRGHQILVGRSESEDQNLKIANQKGRNLNLVLTILDPFLLGDS